LLEEERLVETASAQADKPAWSYCKAITHEGERFLNREQYEAFVSMGRSCDIFIDGFTREVLHGGRARQSLTPGEFAIISEYIETRKVMRPFATQTGSARSREAAVKLFETARRKVDIKVGRYEYRAFRLHKNCDPKMKAFEFAPPEGLSYCLVIPEQE
jgi:hypothetical protein